MKKLSEQEEKNLELIMWKKMAELNAPISERLLEIIRKKDKEIERLKNECKRL